MGNRQTFYYKHLQTLHTVANEDGYDKCTGELLEQTFIEKYFGTLKPMSKPLVDVYDGTINIDEAIVSIVQYIDANYSDFCTADIAKFISTLTLLFSNDTDEYWDIKGILEHFDGQIEECDARLRKIQEIFTNSSIEHCNPYVLKKIREAVRSISASD